MSDEEEEVLQHREESEGEAAEDPTPPLRASVVPHIVERAGVTFRRAAVDERDRRLRFARAMLAKEREAVASSEGEVTASASAAEGGELAADESGGAVAEGLHEGGSDSQQQKQARPNLTLTP